MKFNIQVGRKWNSNNVILVSFFCSSLGSCCRNSPVAALDLKIYGYGVSCCTVSTSYILKHNLSVSITLLEFTLFSPSLSPHFTKLKHLLIIKSLLNCFGSRTYKILSRTWGLKFFKLVVTMTYIFFTIQIISLISFISAIFWFSIPIKLQTLVHTQKVGWKIQIVGYNGVITLFWLLKQYIFINVAPN